MSATVLRTASGRVSLRIRHRCVLVAALLALVSLAASLMALTLGSYPIGLGDLLQVLAGAADPQKTMVVLEWRLPRAVAAVAFGAALGASGAVFQSLTRNPLGSPDVIGFGMGSFTGVLLVMLLGGSGFAMIAGGALVGGLWTATAVYFLAFRGGVQGFRLIIVGIALSAMLSAVNTWIMVKVDLDFALQAAVWGAGTLNGVAWQQVLPAVATLAVVGVVLAVTVPAVRQLELGDELSALQGLDVERSRLLMMVLGIGLTAVVTAVCGPVSFVALAAPHVARRLTRTSGSIDLVGSAFTGAALLALADLLAQHGIPGTPLPVGAVTVSLGGLYLVWLLARETGRR